MNTLLRFSKFSPGNYVVFKRKGRNHMGLVYFYEPWKSYVFLPYLKTKFSAQSLKEIIDFIEKIK